MKCHNYINNHCNSCELLNLSYDASVALKEDHLADLFSEINTKYFAPVKSQNQGEASRNKAKLAVKLIEDEICFGFYTKDLAFKKLEDCPLHHAKINNLLMDLKTTLREFNITPYDIEEKNGELKYVLITFSESSEQLLIRFIMRSKESLERMRKLSKKLVEANSLIKVMTFNIQKEHKAILEGDEEIILTDIDTIEHQFGDITLFQGARSFFQTNSFVALKLYETIALEVKQRKITTLLDLYCGVGAFSLFCAKLGCQTNGVEISKKAIDYAKRAAKTNELENTHFFSADVKDYLSNNEIQDFEAILVNPPRRGIDIEVANKINSLAPKFIFYSSCNAETLFRDYQILSQKYQLESLQVFDMFAFSKHYECLAIMNLRE